MTEKSDKPGHVTAEYHEHCIGAMLLALGSLTQKEIAVKDLIDEKTWLEKRNKKLKRNNKRLRNMVYSLVFTLVVLGLFLGAFVAAKQ